MKHERDLQSQTRRIDREKHNKPVVVRGLLPEVGREGDLIHLGEPPATPKNTLDGYYYRLNGEWRFIGDGVGRTPDTDVNFLGEI